VWDINLRSASKSQKLTVKFGMELRLTATEETHPRVESAVGF